MLISDCKYNLRVKLNVICYIVRYIQLSTDTSYDKIKHLVEIEDDIFSIRLFLKSIFLATVKPYASPLELIVKTANISSSISTKCLILS